MDLPGDSLGAKVACGGFGGEEQQVGLPVDGGAILVLGSREALVVRAKAGFDMADRYVRREAGEGRAHRTGGVALHDEHLRPDAAQVRQDGSSDLAHMPVRIGSAATIQVQLREVGQAVFASVKLLLASENQQRREPAQSQSPRNGRCLIASGLVPTTSQMSAERSFPPSSAGAICLHYGASASGCEL